MGNDKKWPSVNAVTAEVPFAVGASTHEPGLTRLATSVIFKSVVADSPRYGRTKVPFGVVEAINGNIKTLLRRGRGYKNLGYLLLKAQRIAVTKRFSERF